MYVANLRSETLKATCQLMALLVDDHFNQDGELEVLGCWAAGLRKQEKRNNLWPPTMIYVLWCWCESAVSSPLSLWQLKFLTLCWWQSPSNCSTYCTSEYSPYYLIYLLFPKGQHYLTPGRTINLYPNPLTSCKHLVAVHFVQEELVRIPF